MRVTFYAPYAVSEQELIDFLYFTKRRIVGYNFGFTGVRSVTITAAGEDEMEAFTLYAEKMGILRNLPTEAQDKDVSVLDGNAKSVVATLKTLYLTEDETTALLEKERASKNRSSILVILEETLEAFKPPATVETGVITS